MYDAMASAVRKPVNPPGSPSAWLNHAEGEPPDSTQYHADEDEVSFVDAARYDLAAFAPLYRRYLTPVYRYFYQRVASAEVAEDLTSVTFSRALGDLDHYKARGSFAGWLFGIARHVLLDHMRAQYAHDDQEDLQIVGTVGTMLTDPSPGPEEQALRVEQNVRLRHLVDKLPDDQREAIVLRVFGELSTKEVAAVLGKSEAAVKMLVHRGVETLRVRYSVDSQEARS